MTRYICLDTETTGFSPHKGDKIIEIGFVEVIEGIKTGRQLQKYINPGIPISSIITKLTGITNDKISNEPKFIDVVDEILTFLYDDSHETILVAHNAKFDMMFLNFELNSCGKKSLDHPIIDTIDIIRRKFPGHKLTLDAISTKLDVDLSERKKHGHGALLDSQILADVFIALIKDYNIEEHNSFSSKSRDLLIHKRVEIIKPRNIFISQDDINAHKEIISKICQTEW